MRVRVLKEMPFAKVGYIFENLQTGIITINGVLIYPAEIENWINNGWLEEVKEEQTLAEKFEAVTKQNIVTFETYKLNPKLAKHLSDIARQHYLERFDEWFNRHPLMNKPGGLKEELRKIFDEGEK